MLPCALETFNLVCVLSTPKHAQHRRTWGTSGGAQHNPDGCGAGMRGTSRCCTWGPEAEVIINIERQGRVAIRCNCMQTALLCTVLTAVVGCEADTGFRSEPGSTTDALPLRHVLWRLRVVLFTNSMQS